MQFQAFQTVCQYTSQAPRRQPPTLRESYKRSRHNTITVIVGRQVTRICDIMWESPMSLPRAIKHDTRKVPCTRTFSYRSSVHGQRRGILTSPPVLATGFYFRLLDSGGEHKRALAVIEEPRPDLQGHRKRKTGSKLTTEPVSFSAVTLFAKVSHPVNEASQFIGHPNISTLFSFVTPPRLQLHGYLLLCSLTPPPPFRFRTREPSTS